MCVVQLRREGSEIATILNEFNQSLERKKTLNCRRLLTASKKLGTAKKSDRTARAVRVIPAENLVIT